VTSSELQPLIPVGTAIIGLVAGLLAPLMGGFAESSRQRRSSQRQYCDQILSLFGDVRVYHALTAPAEGVRRQLLLLSVRLNDERARNACSDLVAYAAGADATENEVIERWAAMVNEVARVFRSEA
jgi:hypothetical protein